MAFDREIIEAQLALEQITSSDLPEITWDALEAGLDGHAIRRLAALDSATYFEVRDVLPLAMQEMSMNILTRGEAALRLAKNRASEILKSGDDPLKHTRDFERLWIDAGYPRALASVGNLCDEVYIASSNLSDDQIRDFIVKQLKDLIEP